MRKCPFCAEGIQDEAIKCRHCGEFLLQRPEIGAKDESRPWYFRTAFIVIALLSVGPLALPLIWWRPNTAMAWKAGLTVLVLVLSWFLYLATVQSIETLTEYYRFLDSL